MDVFIFRKAMNNKKQIKPSGVNGSDMDDSAKKKEMLPLNLQKEKVYEILKVKVYLQFYNFPLSED